MKFLVLLAAFVAVASVAVSVKEWKNFENGKVYSHKMRIDDEIKTHTTSKAPVVPERLLHSHHRDKKLRSSVQTTEVQPRKNAERHHRKNVEEEMHLRPLNERHHKFPNPALLDENRDYNTPGQISKQNMLKQNGRRNNKRRERGRRRNRPDQKTSPIDNTEKVNENENSQIEITTRKTYSKPADVKSARITEAQSVRFKNGFPSKMPSYW